MVNYYHQKNETMNSTILNPRTNHLLIKKNIIVKFDSISNAKKTGKSNKNDQTLPTSTTFPTI